jgi:hypothetical protein
MASEKNRLQKVLEDANIKLTTVVSKVGGVSSMNLIQALMTKDELTRVCHQTAGTIRIYCNQGCCLEVKPIFGPNSHDS